MEIAIHDSNQLLGSQECLKTQGRKIIPCPGRSTVSRTYSFDLSGSIDRTRFGCVGLKVPGTLDI